MAGITLAIAQAALDRWLLADAALASSQSYEMESEGMRRKLTRADAGEIRRNIEKWDRLVKNMTPGARRRIRYLVPE